MSEKLTAGQKRAARLLESLRKNWRTEIPGGESWARVELFRWQYGELPGADEKRPLDEAAGMRAMAHAIEAGDQDNFPSPQNVVSVLLYAANRLDSRKEG